MKALLNILLFSILLSATPSRVSAQEQFIEQPSRYLVSVPFKLLTGGVILLKAKVNDYPDSLNFILDTGSGGISLDSTTVVRLGITLQPSDKTIKGIGGLRKVSFLYNAKLKLPGLETDRLNFHVNDYEILSYVYGIPIDGIIGYSFFSRYIVNLNYDNLMMHVFTVGEYKYPAAGHTLRPLFTALPIQQIRFKDEGKYFGKFYLDTGAGLNFLLSESYARDSAVLKKKRKGPFITQAEGLGGKTSMRITTVKEVKIGPYRFRKVPSFVFKDEYNVTNYPEVGGLIGNDLMRRFNVTLNYTKQEIHIVPNSHYRDLFDYAYSGLSVYYIDNQVSVDDVVPGSPADKAGFKKDDVILSVNNDISNNIQTYKTMMQTTGQRLSFVVLRNGKPMMMSMKPVKIY
jgi:predicted aspartyl protease